MPLVHHELCFGCGAANLFGILLEVEPAGKGTVAGRCFIKQDHQGSDRQFAHEGVLVAALSEAMALAGGIDARASKLEVELTQRSPVGAFVWIEAEAKWSADAAWIHAQASGRADGQLVAKARGTYRRR